MFQADPFVLARIQFATNITFHILFPTISIGLGWVLLFFKTRFTATGQQHWMDSYQFWITLLQLDHYLSFSAGCAAGRRD